MKILLSIKPEYVQRIMDGTKKFEYRRRIFKRKNINTVVIYATKPVGKVIGEFKIKKVISDSPQTVWHKTHKYAGLNEEDFYKYFNGINEAFAIQISEFTKYNTHLDLSELEDGNIRAPQSFIYLDN